MTDSKLYSHDMDIELLLNTAQLAAVTVLESGGETSRAEETATIICKSYGESAQAIALPTGIFITVENADGHKMTSTARVRSRSVNLHRVERTNAYSRDFAAGKITLSELNTRLNELRQDILYKKLLTLIATGLSASAFALLFEESLGWACIYDMLVAFLASFIAQSVALSPRMKWTYQFTSTFLSATIITVIATACVRGVGIGDLNCVIIGSIMPFLPGLSLTNAIRDTVMGDIISGTVRIVETLLIAIAIAGGVGLVLISYVNLFGGVV